MEYGAVLERLFPDTGHRQIITNKLGALTDPLYTVGETGGAQTRTGIEIIKEFLGQIPNGQGVYQNFYDKAARRLLEESSEGGAESQGTLQAMATSLGNCATPVKDFLVQKAIGMSSQRDSLVSSLIARQALEEKFIGALNLEIENKKKELGAARRSGDQTKVEEIEKEIGGLDIKNEQVEFVASIVDTVYLEGAISNIKIKGERTYSPSKTNHGFAVPEQWIPIFLNICCQTDAQGELLKTGEGYYVLDNGKLKSINEEYEKRLGPVSDRELLVGKFEAELKKIGETRASELLIYHFDKEDVVQLFGRYYIDKLRDDLRKAADGDIEKVYKNSLFEVTDKIEEVSKKYKGIEERSEQEPSEAMDHTKDHDGQISSVEDVVPQV
ncbi:hypothetical protein V1387_18460, partial [Allomuricauda taeanensis]|uniref:hypothetical protein n=1 Tax=Flagellimonas taeanensis TaxID=1005926 RepID=UPI002E7BF3E0